MTGSRPDWAAIGRIIGEQRRALGISKNEAARRGGVSNTTWRLLEAGANRNPTDETLVRVAKVVGVEPELLFRAASRIAPAPVGTTAVEFAPVEPVRHGLQPNHRRSPSLPAGFPQCRTPYFIGRRQVMERIAGYLQRWEGAVPPLVLTGLAGIGKTEVAARYMVHQRDAYEQLAWVDASSAETAVAGLGKVARVLGIRGAGGQRGRERLGTLAPAVVGKLREDGRRWLVVIDNIGHEAVAEEFLKELATEPSSVRVLMTSRRSARWSRAARLPLGPLELGDAAEFLRQRTGSVLQAAPAGQDAPAEDPAAALAAELGYLPRALDRAGAYVDRTGISLRSCLSLARELRAGDRLLDLLDDPDGTAGLVDWLPEPRQPGRPDWDLLRILAFLGRDPLDPAYLTQPSAALPRSLQGLRKEQLFDSELKKLQDRSLVEVDGDGLRVHSITQAAVRRSLGGERGTWATTALRLLLSVFPWPDGGPATRAACQHLLPHAQAAVRYARLHDAGKQETAWLLGRMAEHLRLEGLLEAARQHAQDAVQRLDAAEVPASEAVLVRLTRALVHVDFGEFEAARTQADEAAEAEKARVATNAPDVKPGTMELLEALLAVIDAQLGRYDDAYQRVQRIGDFLEKQAGSPPSRTVAVRSTVALALKFLDETDEARRHFAKALTHRRALTGTRNHGFALDCYWLACVELRAEQPHRAAYWFQLGLDIFRDLYGAQAKHPRIGDCLRGLAAVDRLAGNLQAALDRLEEADTVYRGIYGFEHPVRRTIGPTRDLLRAMLHRQADHPTRAPDRASASEQAGAEPPPASAVRRYTQQKLAIGNYTRGFEQDAEAVTALHLGVRLMDFGALDDSLASLTACVRLARPRSLLALSAQLRCGQALARRNDPDAAREAYREIIAATREIIAAARRDADARTPTVGAVHLRARAERELQRLDAQLSTV